MYITLNLKVKDIDFDRYVNSESYRQAFNKIKNIL